MIAGGQPMSCWLVAHLLAGLPLPMLSCLSFTLMWLPSRRNLPQSYAAEFSEVALEAGVAMKSPMAIRKLVKGRASPIATPGHALTFEAVVAMCQTLELVFHGAGRGRLANGLQS